MNKEDLKRLRSLLLEDEKKLEEQLKNLSHVYFGDDIDSGEEEADEAEEKVMNAASIKVVQNHLNGIKKALKKMDEGTYGVCEKCGKDISLELLDVNPESELCQDCKKANG